MISDINYNIENVKPDYQLALLNYYTNINNKLNKLEDGDYKTIEDIRNIIDEEMAKIVNILNCRILTVKEDM